MATKCVYLFVYGSLRSGFRDSSFDYLSAHFTLVGQAFAKGKLYDAGNFPVAVYTTENNYIVGELYVANNAQAFDYVIEQLDDYEGVNGEDAAYQRVTTTVMCSGKECEAWVYWFAKDTSHFTLIDSGDMMNYKRADH